MLPYSISPSALIWDEWNLEHIARHGVTRDEAMEVCGGRFIVLRCYAGRFIVVGQSADGRAMSIVIEPEDEWKYYVVTARSSSRSERRAYREVIDE